MSDREQPLLLCIVSFFALYGTDPETKPAGSTLPRAGQHDPVLMDLGDLIDNVEIGLRQRDPVSLFVQIRVDKDFRQSRILLKGFLADPDVELRVSGGPVSGAVEDVRKPEGEGSQHDPADHGEFIFEQLHLVTVHHLP